MHTSHIIRMAHQYINFKACNRDDEHTTYCVIDYSRANTFNPIFNCNYKNISTIITFNWSVQQYSTFKNMFQKCVRQLLYCMKFIKNTNIWVSYPCFDHTIKKNDSSYYTFTNHLDYCSCLHTISVHVSMWIAQEFPLKLHVLPSQDMGTLFCWKVHEAIHITNRENILYCFEFWFGCWFVSQ